MKLFTLPSLPYTYAYIQSVIMIISNGSLHTYDEWYFVSLTQKLWACRIDTDYEKLKYSLKIDLKGKMFSL